MKQLFEPALSLQSIETIFARISEITSGFDSMYPDNSVELKLESAFNQVRGIYITKGHKLGSTEIDVADINQYINDTLDYRYHPENIEQIKHDVVVIPESHIDYSPEYTGKSYIEMAFNNYLHMYSAYNYMWKFFDFLIKELKMTSTKFSRLMNDDLYKVRAELYSKMKSTYIHLLSFATLSQNQNFIKLVTDIIVSTLYVSDSQEDEDQFSVYQHITFNKETNHGPGHFDHSDRFVEEIKAAKKSIMEK